MTRQEVHRLFDLLGNLYRGKCRSRDDVTVAIWAEVLKPWSYEQVRTAVVERARVNRYYPDPSEIAEFLPKTEEPARDRYAPPSPETLRQMAELKAWQEEWHRELHEKGLPTMREAEESGMSFREWENLMKEAGEF